MNTHSSQATASTSTGTTQATSLDAAPLEAREVVIEIGIECVYWYGSRAQIEAEGVLPPDFEWADGQSVKKAGWSYWLVRCRPDCMSGVEWRTSSRDHWRLRRLPDPHAFKSIDQQRMEEKRRELAEAEWRLTPAGKAQWQTMLRAIEDKPLQGFLIAVGAKKQRKPRQKRA